MNLADVTKVEDFIYKTTVNTYLDLGWKLIGFYTTCYDTESPRCYHQTGHYVIAWVGDNPKYPPEPKPSTHLFGWDDEETTQPE